MHTTNSPTSIFHYSQVILKARRDKTPQDTFFVLGWLVKSVASLALYCSSNTKKRRELEKQVSSMELRLRFIEGDMNDIHPKLN
jgi:hypothetical protein